MSNNAKYYLSKLYKSVYGCSDAVSLCSSYSDILQIKHDNPELANLKNSVYVDIKCFIEEYVSMVSHEKRDFGYDSVDLSKIDKFISFCPDANRRIELFRYASIQLSSRGFLQEAEYCNKKHVKGRAISHINRSDFPHKLKGILSLIINNVWLCLLLVAMVLLLHYVILLPYSAANYAIFEISYSTYVDNFYLNHLLNFIGYLFGINESPFCKPLGFTGILLIVCLRLFYMLFVGGTLVDILKKCIR